MQPTFSIYFYKTFVPTGLYCYIRFVNRRHYKDKVLKTGVELFCTRGYNALGVDEICKTTGMTKGAFYNAFKSKENFLLEAISVYCKMTVERLKTLLSPKHTNVKAIDRLTHLYEFMLDAQPKNNYAGCMINNMMSELGIINSTVGNATSIEFDHFIDAILPCVEEAQRDGDLNSNIDAKELTELLHTTFYGTLTRAKSLQNHEQGKLIMQLLIKTLKQ